MKLNNIIKILLIIYMIIVLFVLIKFLFVSDNTSLNL